MSSHDDGTSGSGANVTPDVVSGGCIQKIANLKVPSANRLRMEEAIERAPIPPQPEPERHRALLEVARVVAVNGGVPGSSRMTVANAQITYASKGG